MHLLPSKKILALLIPLVFSGCAIIYPGASSTKSTQASKSNGKTSDTINDNSATNSYLLGALNVESYNNEPLYAEIDLGSRGPSTEPGNESRYSNTVVTAVNPETNENYKTQFIPETANSSAKLLVQSSRNISAPVTDINVTIKGPSGVVEKTYSVMTDPAPVPVLKTTRVLVDNSRDLKTTFPHTKRGKKTKFSPIAANADASQMRQAPYSSQSGGSTSSAITSTVKHLVSKGDTLSQLARTYYRDQGIGVKAGVKMIINANKGLIKHATMIRTGTTLDIPGVFQKNNVVVTVNPSEENNEKVKINRALPAIENKNAPAYPEVIIQHREKMNTAQSDIDKEKVQEKINVLERELTILKNSISEK